MKSRRQQRIMFTVNDPDEDVRELAYVAERIKVQAEKEIARPARLLKQSISEMINNDIKE